MNHPSAPVLVLWAFVSVSNCANPQSIGDSNPIPFEESHTAVPHSQHESPVALLFAVQHAHEYTAEGTRQDWFAVPVACVDSSGSFVSTPAMCVESFAEGLTLYGVDTTELFVTWGTLVDVFDSYERGLPLPGDPSERLLYWTSDGVSPLRPTCGSPTDMPLVAGVSIEERTRAGLDQLIGPNAADSMSQPWVARSAIEGDFDSDGQPDLLLGNRFDPESGFAGRCELVGGVWGDQSPAPGIIEVSCDQPTDWSLSGRIGPFDLAGSSCWDLNQDGRVELWLAMGFDSQREHEFIEIQDRRFVRVGDSIWFGD